MVATLVLLLTAAMLLGTALAMVVDALHLTSAFFLLVPGVVPLLGRAATVMAAGSSFFTALAVLVDAVHATFASFLLFAVVMPVLHGVEVTTATALTVPALVLAEDVAHSPSFAVTEVDDDEDATHVEDFFVLLVEMLV